MVTEKALGELCADNLPSEHLALVGIYFARQDMAMGIYGSAKTIHLLRGYYDDLINMAEISVEATALKGTILVYQERIREILNEALSGEAELEQVKKAQLALELAGQVVKRIEHLSALLDSADWRMPNAAQS